MIKIEFDGATDTGRVRTNNEDSYAVQYIDDESRVLCLVIDGIGGYEGGEVAAEITRQTVINYLEEHREGSLVERLKAAMTAANNEIVTRASASPQLGSMGCVATAAIIDPEDSTLTIAHVGDTRLYRYADGQLVKLTHDHSIVGYREETGQLTELEAMRHPNRNLIERSLGERFHMADDQNFLEAAKYPVDSSCTLLLCSDGLCDMITSAAMVEELQRDLPLNDIALRLIHKANDAGGRDNVTVALARITVGRPVVAQTAPDSTNTSDSDSDSTTRAASGPAGDSTTRTVSGPAGDNSQAGPAGETRAEARTVEIPLDEVKGSRRTMQLSPRNIALAVCVAVLVFFGGYMAAIAVAKVKSDNIQAELDVCRKSLKTSQEETTALKDSLDRQQITIEQLKATVPPQSNTDPEELNPEEAHELVLQRMEQKKTQ